MERASRAGLAVAYTAICIIWGSTYLAIKVGLAAFDPFFYAGLRYLLATAAGWAILRSLKVPLAGPLARWLPAFGVGVLFVGVCNGMVFWAETRLDSGYTALLITANPLWIAFFEVFVPGESRLSWRGWLGLGVGLLGTGLLLEPWRGGRLELGAALVVELSVIIWSATALWVRRIKDRFHPFALSVAQMAAGGAVLLGVAAGRGRALVGPVGWQAVTGLAFLVVFGSLIAFGAYFYLLKHWPASRVATSTYVNPVVAVLAGWLLLGERVSISMIVATGVILAGVALVLREEPDAAVEEERT
ncbi:MAG TPA: EamA family transporter [Thermoanaerobaculaceae bacterium]|nr:EamA family transporter [Thermoanaerobaculaceae bacterium]HRS15792.1 EamA family transporter [Thermoanaerobaculaceae bacterium]